MASQNKSQSSLNVYDGSDDIDVKKFFFFFDYVIGRGKSDDEKAVDLLSHPDGKAFDFYYNTFADKGILLPIAGDYAKVKEIFMKHFDKPTKPPPTPTEPEPPLKPPSPLKLAPSQLLKPVKSEQVNPHRTLRQIRDEWLLTGTPPPIPYKKFI
eukprot:GO255559.1.p1 GENE.GO255559.1~~GO255559.1.p1  ORF type:complete len:154 (+),score=10.92 GO255559.1:137-598(+)